MLGIRGRERNRVNCVTGEDGFQQWLYYWKQRYTQSPFGWSKLEPSALPLKKIWDFNGVAIIKAA